MKKVSLINFLFEDKDQEVLFTLKNGNFDIQEKTNSGHDLFVFSLYLGKFEIAKKLLDIKIDGENYFSKDLDENVAIACIYKLTEDPKDYDSIINNFLDFKIRNQLNFKLNFFNLIDELIKLNYEEKDFEFLSNKKNRKILKDFFDFNVLSEVNHNENIKKLSKFNSTVLINWYLEIYEIDDLKLVKNPIFLMLKDYLLNTNKYNSRVSVSDLISHQEKESFDIELKNRLECINSDKEFINFFNSKKNKFNFSNHFYKIQTKEYNKETKRTPTDFENSIVFDYLEIETIQNDLNCFLKNSSNDKEDFVKDYLVTWVLSHFKNRSNNQYLDINKNQLSELEGLMNKYSLKDIVIHKDSDVNKEIEFLKKELDITQKFFKVENNNLGNNELIILLERNENLYQGLGSFYRDLNIIRISEKIKHFEDNVFLHEYTHYLQSYSKDLKKDFYEMQNEFKKWENYDKKDFTEYLIGILDFKNNFEQKEEISLKKLIEDNLSTDITPNETIENIRKKSLVSLNEKTCSYLNEQIVDYKEEILKIIEVYYKTQKEKHLSFEQEIGLKKDEELKRKYWLLPIEIHARINQEFLVNKNKISINPKKIEKMKNLINGLNEMFIENMKKRNLKKSVQSKKKAL